MGNQNKYKSGSIFDMQFITSSISTTLVLLLLGLVVFFVLTAHNLSVYVRENISFSVLISDDMKEADILKLQKKLNQEPFVKQSEYISKKQALKEQTRQWEPTRKNSWAITPLPLPSKSSSIPTMPIPTASRR